MFINIGLILIGFIVLFAGAEGLVRGSSSLALRLGISPLVIGLTVVAFGTSMPELVVSIKTAITHHGSIAVGNVVGSNIFNIAVILGISALICPMKVKIQLVRLDAPVMITVSLLFWFIFRDFHISRTEGIVLFSGIILYTLGNFLLARRESDTKNTSGIEEIIPGTMKHISSDFLFIIGGLGLLIAGSHALVEGASGLARLLGVSEAVIGLTIIAAGTSLPELATSVVAAFRREPDIAIGNVVGSNIFNILCILGASSLIAPLDGAGIRMTDIYVMLGTSILLLPLLRTGFVLQRWEGSVLVGVYGVYLYFLLL
ncbi:MAG: calcium/sodium antiporter [Candidatus Latescibacteria bacterium]|nr:calcium/sodium antiporter [Candidatus Latescibacterota bacterium]